MYSRVQETFGHWTSIQRETMSSELLQQKTFSVLYYRSIKQAVTFVREKTFGTINRCKQQQRRKQQGSSQTKNVPILSKFRLLAGLKLVLKAFTSSRCQAFTSGFGSELLEAAEQKNSVKQYHPISISSKATTTVTIYIKNQTFGSNAFISQTAGKPTYSPPFFHLFPIQT